MKIGKIEVDANVNKDDTSFIDIVKNGEVVRRTKVVSWKKQEVYDAKYNGAGLIIEMKTPMAGTFYAFYTSKDEGLCRSVNTALSAMPILESKKKQILKNF